MCLSKKKFEVQISYTFERNLYSSDNDQGDFIPFDYRLMFLEHLLCRNTFTKSLPFHSFLFHKTHQIPVTHQQLSELFPERNLLPIPFIRSEFYPEIFPQHSWPPHCSLAPRDELSPALMKSAAIFQFFPARP